MGGAVAGTVGTLESYVDRVTGGDGFRAALAWSGLASGSFVVQRGSRIMALMEISSPAPPPRFARGGHIYVGPPPAPLHFPAEEEVPETKPNLDRRIALYESLRSEIAGSATIGSDQFVYWDPTSVVKRCAPDVFVKLGVPDSRFDVWKVWQRGAPELAVEIVSKSDRPEDEWSEKFVRYHALGVLELVRFDPEDPDQPISVWDRIDGELVERAADDPRRLLCNTLGLWWTVVDMPGIGPALRLARDEAGTDLLPTPREAQAREAEARAREAEARARAEQERDALRKELEALRATSGSSPRTKAVKKASAPSRPKPRKRRA